MDTFFLNEHAQLNRWFKLKKTSVNTFLNELFLKGNFLVFNFCVDTLFLNEHTQLKNKTKLKKTSAQTLLNEVFKNKSY